MSVEQAIHTRWAADPALASLVPPARLITGPPLAPLPLPWAMLERTGPARVRGGSHYQVVELELAISIWHAELAGAKAIAAALAGNLHGASFASSEGTILRVVTAHQRETRAANAAWHLTQTFALLVARPRA